MRDDYYKYVNNVLVAKQFVIDGLRVRAGLMNVSRPKWSPSLLAYTVVWIHSRKSIERCI
jgi:hypothetical protein